MSSQPRERLLSSAMNPTEGSNLTKSTSKLKAIASIKFPDKHYMFEKELGSGVQSTVWLFRMDGQKYAGKVTSNDWIYEERKGDPQYWRKRMLSLCREIIFLQMIDSPHVIRQIEIIKTRSNYYSVLEFANGGSLQGFLNIRRRFSERFAVKALHQIVKGCQALYKVNVMHRDLKLDNILIHFENKDELTKEDLEEIDMDNEPFCVKIADLGYARELTRQEEGRAKSFKGSPLMMAPEQLNTYWGRGSGYSHKIDVWAIGVIFYQMLTGMFMFTVERQTRRQDAMSALYNKMREGTWSWPTDIQISLNTFDFLNKTMQHDPLNRPTWQEMMAHPMFTETAESRNNKITLDIVCDQEPQEGIKFEDNKIYVNTKDPTLYERLYNQAIKTFMEENEQNFEEHADSMLVSQDRTVKKLFPRMSRQLKGQPDTVEESKQKGNKLIESRLAFSGEGQQMEFGGHEHRSFHSQVSEQEVDAMAEMGISHFSQTLKYSNIQEQLNDPENYLKNQIPGTRDTFLTGSPMTQSMDRHSDLDARGCCATKGSKQQCVIF